MDQERRGYTGFTGNGDYAQVWQSHLAEEELRKSYSQAVLKLATEKWPNSRIQWCFETIFEYFHNGGLDSSLIRERKRVFRDNVQLNLELSDMSFPNLVRYEFDVGKKLKLLDVGSCYNPFSIFEELQSFAVDLTPATKDVFQCDFLQLKVLPGPLPSMILPLENLEQLPPEAFHIVVFSLVLEYLPAPEQRLTFCHKAWQLLQDMGLLLIITPDSKSINYNAPMMKSWKTALERLGFQRYKYEKKKHLHCMAFWKNIYKPSSLLSNEFSEFSKFLYIPQDFKDFKDKPIPANRTGEENEEVQRIFSELPLFEASDVR